MSLDADIKVVQDAVVAKAIPLQVYQDLFWTLTDDQKEKFIHAGLNMLFTRAESMEMRYGSDSPQYWNAIRAFVKLKLEYGYM